MALQTKTISYGSLEYGSASNAYVLELILTEEAVDKLANTSRVSFRFLLRSGAQNRFTDNIDCAVVIAGQEFTHTDKQITAAYNHTYTLLAGELTVPHAPDGTLLLTAQASIDTPESNPYAPPDILFAGEMALTPIPRASTLAATAAFIEDAATIVVSRKSPEYTHSIFYAFGSLSGYLGDSVGTHSQQEVKLTDTTLLFPLPEAFYGELPHSPSGICTLTCVTYRGDTPIGQPQTASFTVTADPARCAPTVGGTAGDVNEVSLAVTGDPQVLVQGISHARCTVLAQARKGAAIQAVYVNGAPMEGTEHTITAVSSQAITFRAVDSRGYSGEFTVPGLQFVPYVPLSFHGSASRTDPTGGNAIVSIRGKWYCGTIGPAENTLEASVRADGGSWVRLPVTTDGGDFTATAQVSGLDYRTGHTLQVQLGDALQTLTKTFTVSKGIPVFDWGEEDFAFHVPVRFTATDGTEFTLDLVNGQLTAIS